MLNKCKSVLCSCKTIEQYANAITYVNLACKNNYLTLTEMVDISIYLEMLNKKWHDNR